MQRTHSSHKAQAPTKKIVLLCDNVQGPANVGSIFRLADAFGVHEIIFGGKAPDTSSSRLKKTARNTEKIVRFRESQNLILAIQDLMSDGFTPIALEITSDSVPITKYPKNKNAIALIIGAEAHGVSQELLDIAHQTLHIPMLGVNSSMNVSQATGIALFALTA